MLLGLYVQVPFCQTKCTYCNFHTGVFSNDLYAPYVEAVCREIATYPILLRESRIAEVPEPVVDTAYFGGGTPSLLDPAGLARGLHAIRAAFECKFEEGTPEADPETIIPEKAATWDPKSTRLNSRHSQNSYAVFFLTKKNKPRTGSI